MSTHVFVYAATSGQHHCGLQLVSNTTSALVDFDPTYDSSASNGYASVRFDQPQPTNRLYVGEVARDLDILAAELKGIQYPNYDLFKFNCRCHVLSTTKHLNLNILLVFEFIRKTAIANAMEYCMIGFAGLALFGVSPFIAGVSTLTAGSLITGVFLQNYMEYCR